MVINPFHFREYEPSQLWIFAVPNIQNWDSSEVKTFKKNDIWPPTRLQRDRFLSIRGGVIFYSIWCVVGFVPVSAMWLILRGQQSSLLQSKLGQLIGEDENGGGNSTVYEVFSIIVYI